MENAFDEEAFLKEMGLARSIAADVNAPHDVKALEYTQAGTPLLMGLCPCGTLAALSGEGRHLCRRCGKWLNYVKCPASECKPLLVAVARAHPSLQRVKE